MISAWWLSLPLESATESHGTLSRTEKFNHRSNPEPSLQLCVTRRQLLVLLTGLHRTYLILFLLLSFLVALLCETNEQLLVFLQDFLGTAPPPVVRNGYAFPLTLRITLGCALTLGLLKV